MRSPRKSYLKLIPLFAFAVALVIVNACSVPKKSAAYAQLQPKNYQEVIGDTTDADKVPDVFAKYPDGLAGIESCQDRIVSPDLADPLDDHSVTSNGKFSRGSPIHS